MSSRELGGDYESSFGKAIKQGASRAVLWVVIPVFSYTAGTTVPLRAEQDGPGEQVTLVTPNSWTKGTAMPKALKFAMMGVISGKVSVVGGATNTAVVTNNQVYNPLTNTWSSKAAIPMPTCDAASAIVKNILYVFGGSNDGLTVTNAVWAYNPTTFVIR